MNIDLNLFKAPVDKDSLLVINAMTKRTASHRILMLRPGKLLMRRRQRSSALVNSTTCRATFHHPIRMLGKNIRNHRDGDAAE